MHLGSCEVFTDSTGRTYVSDLSRWPAASATDVTRLVTAALAHRAQGSTDVHQDSSRSHCLVALHVRTTWQTGAGRQDTTAVLHIVDLAGSENAADSGATGDQLTESAAINRSLSALCDVCTRRHARVFSSPCHHEGAAGAPGEAGVRALPQLKAHTLSQGA